MSLLVDGLDQIRNYVEFDKHDPRFRAVTTTLAGVFGLLYAALLAADGYWFPVFVAAGFVLGSLSSSKRHPSEPRLFQASSLEHEVVQEELSEEQQLSLFYPPLTEAVDKLIGYFHRDYVLSWWNPLNLHHAPGFEKIVRARLNGGVQNIEKILIKQERNDLVMATVYGVANVLIIHMRECRSLESSGLSLDNYIYQNPQSPFAQLSSATEQHQQMQALSAVILKRILPPNDASSAVVMSLLTELLATYLFESILTTMSDPDYINCWIVDYLSETPDETKSPGMENGKEIDGLYSVVERAAESLMAAKSENDEMRQSTPQPPLQATLQIETSPLPSSPSQNGTLNSYNTVHQQRPKQGEDTHKLAKVDSITSDDSLPPIPENQRSSVQSSPGPRKRISVPKAEESWNQTPMIFANGTVNFSVMDINGAQADGIPQDKSKLMYIIQIERPAMEDQAGSEGGGYVITRTYADFEVFHAIISARHAKRVARINLRLPLDPIRSWLKLGGNNNPPPAATDPDSICRSLERYLFTVVQDIELGRDQIILAFLRKERRSPAGDKSTDTVDISFADEYMDEVSAYAAISSASGVTMPSVAQSSVGKAMSMLARAPSLAVKSVSNGANSLLGNDSSSDLLITSPTQEPTRRWFGRKTMRKGSISSIRSGSTTTSGDVREDTEEEEDVDAPPKIAPDSITPAPTPSPAPQPVDKAEEPATGSGKPLTALDVELLIETTFALVVEIFDLTTANNRAWMRRTLLNLLREIVRRSYTEIIAEQYSNYIQDYLSPDALVQLADKLAQKYWPDGELARSGKERTAEEKEATKEQARKLLIRSGVPSGVRQLIGEQNCVAAMERLWARCQDQSLNRVLLVQLLERIMRPIFG